MRVWKFVVDEEDDDEDEEERAVAAAARAAQAARAAAAAAKKAGGGQSDEEDEEEGAIRTSYSDRFGDTGRDPDHVRPHRRPPEPDHAGSAPPEAAT